MVEMSGIRLCGAISYLASPYGDQYAVAACKAVAHLVHCDILVYSPVTHNIGTMSVAVPGEQAWRHFDASMLNHCDDVLILITDGWSGSDQVKAAICHARARGKKLGVVFEPGGHEKRANYEIEYDGSIVNTIVRVALT